MKKAALCFAALILIFTACSRDFDPLTADDILIDQYEGIKTLPDPYLDNLVLTNQAVGGNTITLIPSFDRNITNYEATIVNPMDAVSFIGTTSHSNATLRVDGETIASGVLSHAVSITNGTNTVNLDVYAQDGLTMRTYTIQIARVTAGGSSNNYLTGLTVSPSNISSFASNTQDYEVSTTYFVSNVTITPTAGHAAAKIWINGVTINSGNSRSYDTTVGTNTYTIRVQAEDYSERIYTLKVVREEAPPSPITSLFITEWGDGSTDEDFIELRNFGTGPVTITSDLKVMIGTTVMGLTLWGTNNDPSSYQSIGSGIKISSGEVIIIVDQDVDTTDLNTIIAFGVPTNTKIFICDDGNPIGSNQRLHQARACLTNSDGGSNWSLTPPTEDFNVGTDYTTFFVLKEGFDPSINYTTNTSWWEYGGASTGPQFRTPGEWP